MNCSVCGAVIPDGQNVCPVCGSVVQSMGEYQQPNMGQPMGGYQQPNMGQPMGGYQQPNMGQPMGGYQQPNMGQPMGGYQQPGMGQPIGAGFGSYFKSLTSDVMKIVGLVGALLLFLTPFFSWVKASFWGQSESENMFGVDEGIYTFTGIMLIIIALVLIVADIADYIPALGNIKSRIGAYINYIELGLIVLALILIIACLANGDVNDVLKAIKEYNGKASHSVGPVFGFIAVIMTAAPRVLKMLNINIGRR